MPDIDDHDSAGEAERSVSAALSQLPLLAPPADQFARIALTLKARQRSRERQRVLLALAAVLAIAAVVPLAWRALQPRDAAPQVATTEAPATAPVAMTPARDLIARNQWLEAMVRAQGEPMDAASAYASAELEDLIGMVDVQLSSSDEPARQEALWQQRLSLMQELASVRTQGMSVVRNDEPALMPASYQID